MTPVLGALLIHSHPVVTTPPSLTPRAAARLHMAEKYMEEN